MMSHHEPSDRFNRLMNDIQGRLSAAGWVETMSMGDWIACAQRDLESTKLAPCKVTTITGTAPIDMYIALSDEFGCRTVADSLLALREAQIPSERISGWIADFAFTRCIHLSNAVHEGYPHLRRELAAASARLDALLRR